MTRFAFAFLIAATAFLAGMAVDRYALSPSRPLVASGAKGAKSSNDKPLIAQLVAQLPAATSAPAKPGQASPSASPASDEEIMAALKSAMAHPSDRHGYLEASKLIDGIDPKNIRPIIAAFQDLPNQREKSMYLGDAHFALGGSANRRPRSTTLKATATPPIAE